MSTQWCDGCGYEREEIKRGLCPQCRAESAEVRVLELKAENATLREFVQALLAQLSEDYGDYEGELPRTIAQMFIDAKGCRSGKSQLAAACGGTP